MVLGPSSNILVGCPGTGTPQGYVFVKTLGNLNYPNVQAYFSGDPLFTQTGTNFAGPGALAATSEFFVFGAMLEANSGQASSGALYSTLPEERFSCVH